MGIFWEEGATMAGGPFSAVPDLSDPYELHNSEKKKQGWRVQLDFYILWRTNACCRNVRVFVVYRYGSGTFFMKYFCGINSSV